MSFLKPDASPAAMAPPPPPEAPAPADANPPVPLAVGATKAQRKTQPRSATIAGLAPTSANLGQKTLIGQ